MRNGYPEFSWGVGRLDIVTETYTDPGVMFKTKEERDSWIGDGATMFSARYKNIPLKRFQAGGKWHREITRIGNRWNDGK